MKRKTLKFILIFIAEIYFIVGCADKITDPLDTIKPTVEITNPFNNSEIAQGTEVKIIANASDNKGVDRVLFFVNNEFQFETSTLPYLFIWPTNDILGSYILNSIVYDKSGNEGISENIGVLIRNYSPGDLCFIEGENYEMGDRKGNGTEDELPLHNVELSDFYIGYFEVTVSEYIEFLNSYDVSENGYYNGIRLIKISSNVTSFLNYDGEFYFTGCSVVNSLSCPVVNVTWFGAVVYCNWKSETEGLSVCYNLSDWSCDINSNGYRLPSEAEWEYAARGGKYELDNFMYSGTTENIEYFAWYMYTANNQTHEIGLKLPNQLGIYDMTGNASEWCNDWYSSEYYNTSTFLNPNGPLDGSKRIVRGGDWINNGLYCRVSNRDYFSPSRDLNNTGFRILKSAN
jgi:formylglycine-generating enzyme required for sulfatase activity